jgi:tetratricopeptide (TPR) repeat protein
MGRNELQMRLTAHFRQTGIRVAVCTLVVMMVLASVRAHPQEPGNGAILKGYVRDSSGRPAANATVFLQLATTAQTPSVPPESTHTDSDGAYRFASLSAGAYVLRAEMTGYGSAIVSRVALARKEMREIDLVLGLPKGSGSQNASSGTPATGKPNAQAPEFFDEPHFTVAGVTQATNSGGHGSDTVLRTTEALAKATVSLSNEKEAGDGSNPPASAATESSLRDAVVRNPNDPALHHQLGDVEEKLGNPLEAVREYQRAAELDPSEPDLFDWGTELLTHRALEPATEVFTKGNRTFPKSVRMLVALGVAWYSRGAYDQAAQYLVNASDLAPDNPTPYLFLGKMQGVETTPSEGSVEKLARFAQLQPDNALANYYYAVSLWKEAAKESGKQSASASDNVAEHSARVESLLLKAVHLDPKLSAAYLQLGILYSQRADFSRAISAYQMAIKVSPEEVGPELDELLEETHYRLAQAYLRTGDKTQAQQELQLHDELSKKTKDDTARERREIQEFVISLQKKDSVPQ